MKKIKTFGSGLFLLELMISIAFFAIAAAGCVQIFAKAHSLSGQAERLDQAVSIAQSLTEENSGQNAEKQRQSIRLRWPCRHRIRCGRFRLR